MKTRIYVNSFYVGKEENGKEWCSLFFVICITYLQPKILDFLIPAKFMKLESYKALFTVAIWKQVFVVIIIITKERN